MQCHQIQRKSENINTADIITDTSVGNRDEEILCNTTLNKGKAQISYYTSYDIGSSSYANQSTDFQHHFFPHYEDFPIPRWREMLHIRSTTSIECNNMVTEREAINSNEYSGQNCPSKRRKIMKADKVMRSGKRKRGSVSCRDYYCYKFQIRPGEKSILLRAGRLFQQYAVDMYVKIETSRLDYFRLNQNDIRAEVYQGIIDSIAYGETDACKVGKRIVLPASFTGGPRDMRKRYIDAMTLVQRYGKPDILLTMTCNPNWLEIKAELFSSEEAQNRPDLCARVFRAKLELLKDELIDEEIFGPVVAYTYVIEYQKIGLPHAHFLLILEKKSKLLSPDSYDRIVSAELPDKEKYPHLYKMVIKHMMHGPYGTMNPKNICMRGGQCKNHYPKKFSSVTTQGDDSYPIYRRRDDGKKVNVRKHILDNRWVVPYSAYLLAKFDCHINVEVCSSIKVVK